MSSEDQEKAKVLLSRLSAVNENVYDFYGALSCVIKTETIQTALKLIMKGKRVYVGSYNIVKCIEQELIKNQDSGLYNDEEYNQFIFELAPLLEKNHCDV